MYNDHIPSPTSTQLLPTFQQTWPYIHTLHLRKKKKRKENQNKLKETFDVTY